jgi:hypothetical protein
MKTKERPSSFSKSASNLSWIRQQGTIECRSLRLRISLLKKIPLARIEQLKGDKRMTIDSIILKLAPEETLRLKRILLDEDKEEALLFLKQCLKPQLDQAARGRMVRAFEEK